MHAVYMRKKIRAKSGKANFRHVRSRKRIHVINPDIDVFHRNIKLNSIYPQENANDFNVFQSNVAVSKSPADKHSQKYIRRKFSIKVLNIIGYFGIIVGCLYQCSSFLAIYFIYPTTVELNVANEAILDFPAVTVCNSNP